MEANKILAPRPEANVILASRQTCEMQQGIQLNDIKLDMLYKLRKPIWLCGMKLDMFSEMSHDLKQCDQICEQ